jgi:hypothetical protein
MSWTEHLCFSFQEVKIFLLRRIRRLANSLFQPLADVVRGDISRLGSQVVLAALPLHPLYIVDIMVYPSQAASFLRSVSPPPLHPLYIVDIMVYPSMVYLTPPLPPPQGYPLLEVSPPPLPPPLFPL